MTKHRKQLVFGQTTIFLAKTSYFSLTIHHKRPKLPAMTKVLRSTFTYQIWIQSMYFVFIDPQQNIMANIAKYFTNEFYIFVYVQTKEIRCEEI